MATVKILIRDNQNKEGLCPIVLRITKERKVKLIALGINCHKSNWDEKSSQFNKSMPNHIQKNLLLSKLKQKAWTIIDQFNIDEVDFTLNQFEEKFRGKESSKVTVLEFWEDKIKDLKYSLFDLSKYEVKDINDFLIES